MTKRKENAVMGRPKIDNPRKPFMVRLDVKTIEKLDAMAEESGETKTAIVENLIIKAKTKNTK